MPLQKVVQKCRPALLRTDAYDDRFVCHIQPALLFSEHFMRSIRFLVTRKDVFSPFPRAHKVELAVFLNEADRLVNDALFNFVVAHFCIPARGKSLRKGYPRNP